MKDKVMEWIVIITILLFAAALTYLALSINHLSSEIQKYFYEVRLK